MMRALGAFRRDVTAGLGFILIGAAALVVGRQYDRGTAESMGPAYVPMLAALVLCGLGVLIAARGLRRAIRDRRFDDILPDSGSRRFAVILAVLGFAWLIERAGLVFAAPALVVIAALGDSDLTLIEVASLAVILTAAAVVIFVWGLGLPLALLPPAFGWS
jgi:hypothetical protein